MHLAEADSLVLRVVPPWLPKAVYGRWWSLVPKSLSMIEVRTLSMNEVRTLSMIEVRTLCRLVEVRKLLRVVEVRKLLRVVDTTPHSPLRQRRCYMTGQNLLDRS